VTAGAPAGHSQMGVGEIDGGVAAT